MEPGAAIHPSSPKPSKQGRRPLRLRHAYDALLSDARNNCHAAQAWVLAEMAKKARHVYWLNPEPRSHWDPGDSVVSQYAVHCDGAYECRNLKQLECFVEQLG
jgi:uncharacterized protein with von Willebrand factor type A (vWA) domain